MHQQQQAMMVNGVNPAMHIPLLIDPISFSPD
jgi:hypothetical protein